MPSGASQSIEHILRGTTHLMNLQKARRIAPRRSAPVPTARTDGGMVARFVPLARRTRASHPSASSCAGASRRSPQLVTTPAFAQSGHRWTTI